ncbi:MAG: hypothetical protein WBX01_06430 [Nitrososphaeraceae archaeon]
MAIPKSLNPALDEDGTNCSQQQVHKDTWFLAGTAAPMESANRACIIPSSKAILFPIVNNLVASHEYPEIKNNDTLKQIAGKDLRRGAEIEFRFNYELAKKEVCRVDCDLFEIMYSEDNIFNSRPGLSTAVSDGFWTFLKPLPQGIHTVYFRASEPNYRTDVRYTLKIE